MLMFIDSEGDPIQEFTALYVDSDSHNIVDVFHRYVAHPSRYGFDSDRWARRHIHGLNRAYLATHGLHDEKALLCEFNAWLDSHPCELLLANAPRKESTFLHRPVHDVCLPCWKDRAVLLSHQLSIFLKRGAVPINGITCSVAHSSFIDWFPRRPYTLSPKDVVKRNFGFHCSLYDCIEIYFYYLK